MQLKAYTTGFMLGITLINHLIHAGDLVVFHPSSAGLQELLNVCTEYGVLYDIMYYAVKSTILTCRTKQDKQLNFLVFKLSDNTLEFHKR